MKKTHLRLGENERVLGFVAFLAFSQLSPVCSEDCLTIIALKLRTLVLTSFSITDAVLFDVVSSAGWPFLAESVSPPASPGYELWSLGLGSLLPW